MLAALHGWVTTGKIVNGTFNHLPVAETDTYQISVDAQGVVVLPYLRVANTLRVRVEMKQITWPTRQDVISTTWVVIGAVAFFGIFFAIVDGIVQRGVERLFKYFGV